MKETKTMKKLFLTFALAVGISVTVNAQTVKRFNPFAIETLDILKATDEQKKQVEEQTKDVIAKIAAIKKNADLSDEEKTKEHQKVNKERSRRFYDEILTPEQAKQLRQIIAENRKSTQAN